MQSEQSYPYGFKKTELANSDYPDERIGRTTIYRDIQSLRQTL